MAISINQIKAGVGLLIDNVIYIVTEYEHVKPGKGSAFVRVRMRNVKTQQVLERTFRSAERLDEVVLEERKIQHLYNDGNAVHFMDHSTYEEVLVPVAVLGDNIKYLQDHLEVTGMFAGDAVLRVELPNFLITDITHTETGLKGDSSKGGTKPATIDTGAVVQVPLFINVGERVKIDTRTGTYVERVQK